MEKTGIILELDKKKAVIMTNEAGFTFIKREPGMFIGQQVDLNQPGIAGIRPVGYGYLLGLTSVAVLIIIFIFTANFHRKANLYAYVTVDINPSIEFTIDKETRVSNVRNLNKDGMTLLRGIKFTNMPIGKALQILAHKAEQDHYFKKGNFMLISAATRGESGKEPELLLESINKVKVELTERDIRVHFIKTTLAERKIALQNHLSMGRYALLTSANTTGRTIGLSEAKTGSVGSLLDKAGMLDKSHEKEEKRKTGIQAEKEKSNLHPGDKALSPQELIQIKNKNQDDVLNDNNNTDGSSEKNPDGNDKDNHSKNTGPGNGGGKNGPAPDDNGTGNSDDGKNDGINDKNNDTDNNSKENSPVSGITVSGDGNERTSSGSDNAGSTATGNNQKTGNNKSQK